MLQLITVVMAIGLTAAVLGTGIGWVSMKVLPRREAAIYAVSGYQTLGTAVTAYRVSNGVVPKATPDGGLPSTLVPAYLAEPLAPEGTSWKYGVTEGKAWLCLTGQLVSEPQWDGFRQAIQGRPTASVGLVASPVDACGTVGVISVKPESFPYPVHLTFNLFE